MKAVQCNWIPVDKLAEYLLMTTTKKLQKQVQTFEDLIRLNDEAKLKVALSQQPMSSTH